MSIQSEIKQKVTLLVDEYIDGLEDTGMEGFDITYDQAKNLLVDFTTFVDNLDSV